MYKSKGTTANPPPQSGGILGALRATEMLDTKPVLPAGKSAKS